MAQQSKADSFSAYLGAWEQNKSSAAASSGSSIELLRVLAANQKKMAVKDLQAASSVEVIDFAEALKNLKESGFLSLSGTGSAQTAELTSLGEQVSKLK